MQHSSINYSDNMKWYTPEIQVLFHAASITSHEPTKRMWYGKIAELRVIC